MAKTNFLYIENCSNCQHAIKQSQNTPMLKKYIDTTTAIKYYCNIQHIEKDCYDQCKDYIPKLLDTGKVTFVTATSSVED